MIARAASTFSLLIAVAAMAIAGPYSDLNASLRNLTDPEAIRTTVRQSDLATDDPDIAAALKRADARPTAETAQKLQAIIDLKAMAEGGSTAPGTMSDVRSIKASPIYRDPGIHETSNWLSRALQRLRNIRMPEFQGPNWRLPQFTPFGAWLNYLMWVLIGIAAGFLIYAAAKHVRWRRSLERKAKAMMEDDEPARSLDEWLVLADELEAQGRYRDAVRALYLACLLRFDEALIARFDRGQTNWEHLARIQASPRMPANIDFHEPTKRFDRIWYGQQVKGLEDVLLFRTWYTELTETLGRKVA
jgi:hypothetical protein